jgi:hypothetical protein
MSVIVYFRISRDRATAILADADGVVATCREAGMRENGVIGFTIG